MSNRQPVLRGRWLVLAALLMITIRGAAAEEVGVVRAVDLGGAETRTAALMLSGQEAGALAVTPLAIALPGSGEAGTDATSPVLLVPVLLVVELGGTSLLEGATDSEPLIVELYAYAIDSEGGLIANLTQAFQLDLGRHRTALSTRGVKFFGWLDMPPGPHSLRVLALHRPSGRLGLRILPVEIPAWISADTPTLLPPVRLEPAGDWVLVFQQQDPAVPFPIDSGDGPRWPAARPTSEAGSTATFLLLGRGLDRGLRGDLIDPRSKERSEIGLGDLQSVMGSFGGLQALVSTVDLATVPSSPAGDRLGGLATERADDEARLQISTADGAATATVPLRVTRSGGEPVIPADPATVVSQGLGRGGRAPPADRSTRRRSARRIPLAALAEAYRESFERLSTEQLSTDRRTTTLSPIIALETAEIGAGSNEEQERLLRSQVRAAGVLATDDPEALVPLLWLHEQLYRHYHGQRRYLLATHSRQVLARLSDSFLENRDSPRARHLVACALVSLAGYLRQVGSLPAAEKTFQSALEMASGHPAALIGIATIREFYGDYEGAVEMLERLRKTGAADPEVGLRLAINLRRMGSARPAAGLLNDAVESQSPWISALASQELATLHAGERRYDEAIAVLEAAVERHPDVQRLRLQLAATLDRAGRPGTARTVLGQLDPAAGRETGSPRLRYSRMPTEALDEARRSLTDEAHSRLGRIRWPVDSSAAAEGNGATSDSTGDVQ